MNPCKPHLAFAILSVLLSACGSSDQAPQTAEILRPVKTLIVDTQGAVNSREFAGVVDADRKVDLAFRISGTLQRLPVKEGEHVKAGQLLAALDQTDLDIQLRAVKADFERARAEYERASTLLERNLIARADFERTQAQYFVAEAELQRAQQDIEYSTLSSPFEGYIGRRHVENLSEIAARTPVLTLVDLTSLVVRIEVPESVMILAQREGIRPDMYAVFQGREEVQYPLVIKEISTQADAGTQTYPVTLSLPPITDLNVLPGMSAVVGVRPYARPEGQAEVVYLPSQAVLEDAGGRFVFVASPDGGGQAVIDRRNVEVGQLSSFGIAVMSGLSSGEHVVTAGMSQLSAGQHVLLPGTSAGE
ncbi:MAG: efflux RND transporter periplasmic adaptor subunit [Gammaproteobacteria bacterium]|nr:efflux RND transporter periplasmic adaptor subunit [Gammaproteobacteria bacterium]